jgi:hypothetical protein
MPLIFSFWGGQFVVRKPSFFQKNAQIMHFVFEGWFLGSAERVERMA